MIGSKLDRYRDELHALRKEGLSYDLIRGHLRREHRLKVAKSTLADWFENERKVKETEKHTAMVMRTELDGVRERIPRLSVLLQKAEIEDETLKEVHEALPKLIDDWIVMAGIGIQAYGPTNDGVYHEIKWTSCIAALERLVRIKGMLNDLRQSDPVTINIIESVIDMD